LSSAGHWSLRPKGVAVQSCAQKVVWKSALGLVIDNGSLRADSHNGWR
jgi:hypothetical protein